MKQLTWLPDETDAKKRLTASPKEIWRRPPGRPRTTWMKTIRQDMKSENLSVNEAIDVAHKCPDSGDRCLRLMLCTPSGACQKWINVLQKQHLISLTKHFHLSHSWMIIIPVLRTNWSVYVHTAPVRCTIIAGVVFRITDICTLCTIFL